VCSASLPEKTMIRGHSSYCVFLAPASLSWKFGICPGLLLKISF
jgi:hypothetical protein